MRLTVYLYKTNILQLYLHKSELELSYVLECVTPIVDALFNALKHSN